MRSLGDLEIVLNRQALGFEYAADPAQAAAGSDRRKNLAEAERLWIQTNAVIDNAIKHHPTDEDWLETQADARCIWARFSRFSMALEAGDRWREVAWQA